MLRRLLQLYIGLVLYGVSTALFVHANLGADPWDVFHLGVAKQLGISFGTVIILTGAAVLLLWIPIRQMPGLGAVSNVIVLGLAADATLAVLPPLESMVARSALLVGAIVLNAIATGMYIGAGFGPGPRDGLMTGLHARTGWSLRGIRTAIELSVLLIGWLLGGKFGVGTVIYALSIGPLIQLCLPWFSQPVSRNAVSPPREIVS
ncbi:TPA: YczE/YyaS/YitT family protein [Klebsiella pneumoniae]